MAAIIARSVAGWEPIERNYDEPTPSFSRDAPSTSTLLQTSKGAVDKSPQAGLPAHIQAQIAASTSDADSNSVETYFSARSATVNSKSQRMQNSASEGFLRTRYQAEAAQQLEENRRGSDEADRKSRQNIETVPNVPLTLRIQMH